MNAQYAPTKRAGPDSFGVRAGIVSPDYPVLAKFRRGGPLLGLYVGIVSLFAATFVVLTFLVKENDTQRFDRTLGEWIQGTNPPAIIAWLTQSAPYDWVMSNLSALGNFPLAAVVYIAVFAGLYFLGLRLEAVVAVAGSALAFVIGMLLRSIIDRARPSPAFLHIMGHVSGPGFPSGHVMMYVTLFGFVFYIAVVAFRWNAFKAVTLLVTGLLVVLIGMSRVYLGAHWPTDTTAAYLVGWLVVAGMVEIHRVLLHRFEGMQAAPLPFIHHKSAQPVPR